MVRTQIKNQKKNIHRRAHWIESLFKKAEEKLSKENFELFKRFNDYMIIRGLSDNARYKDLSQMVNLAERVDWNWIDVDEDKLKRLVSDIMVRHGDGGKESAYSFALKIYIRKLVRFVFTNDTHKDDENGELPILKFLKGMKNPPSKMTREKLPTDEEVKALINACADSPRDKAMFSLHAEAGTRIGELLNLKIKNFRVDQNGGWIEVDGKTGVRPIRIVSSVPYIVRWINDHPYRDDREYPLFIFTKYTDTHGDPINYQAFNVILKKRLKMAGITKKITSHYFRHKEATDLAGKLTEAESRMRHGWTRTSNMPALYSHLNQDDLDKKMLEIKGVKQKEPEIEQMVECNFCKIKYPNDTVFCDNCSRPLSVEYAIEMEKESKKQQEALILELMRREKASQNKKRYDEGTKAQLKKQQEEIELLKQTIQKLSK